MGAIAEGATGLGAGVTMIGRGGRHSEILSAWGMNRAPHRVATGVDYHVSRVNEAASAERQQGKCGQ